MQKLSKYQEAPLSRREALASLNISLEVKVAALNRMEAEAMKTMGPAQVSREAKQLVDNVIKIDQGFERVKIDLGGVDAGIFRGKPVEKLQPLWAGYQRRFTSLIWKSNTVARKTGAYVKEFVNVILPTLEDLRCNAEYRDAAADLREFAGRKNPFEHELNGSEDHIHTRAFTELRYDIKTFGENFELFIDEQRLELDEEILRLQDDISELNWRIKRSDALFQIPALGKALAVAMPTPEKGSLAALSALALFSPSPALGIFLSGATDAIPEYNDVVLFISKISGDCPPRLLPLNMGVLMKSTEYQDEISVYQSQIDAQKTKLSAPKLIHAILRSQGTAFDDGCGRVDRFATIWTSVAQDAALIVSDLERATHAADGHSAYKVGLSASCVSGFGMLIPSGVKVFVTRARLIRITYGVLVGLLKDYTRHIERHAFRFGQATVQ
ncbi:hypothetical protein DXG01_016736 [Tephrocybe rancida]|nr:hypothetical protein DXG01_016736 [Tephrocybe rancida]